MNRETPSRILALNKFIKLFKDEISVQAEISDFEKNLIQNVFERRFLLQYHDGEHWVKLARTFYHFINQGSFLNAKEIAISFLNTANLMQFELNEAYDQARCFRDLKGLPVFKKRIQNALSYYKLLYERVYRLVISPIVYGYFFYSKSRDKLLVPKSDGRIVLSALEKIEFWKKEPDRRLSYGLNSHIRNAFGHESYRILDDGLFEIWDLHPKTPSIRWGPEQWHADQLEALCVKLEQSIEAAVLSICLYSVNNRKLIRAHDWNPTITPPQLTRSDLKSFIEHVANSLCYEMTKCNIGEENVLVELKTRPRGIDQVMEIFEGFKGGARKYLQDVKYIEVLNITQVLGLFQAIEFHLKGYKAITCDIRDYEGSLVGSASIPVLSLTNLSGNNSPLTEARKHLSIDTLGTTKTWMKRTKMPVAV